MAFTLQIPTPTGPVPITVETGSSVVIVGANGSGKTRLAVLLENDLGLNAHRISAHRALGLNTEVPKLSERVALAGLRFGYANADAALPYRAGNRWGGKESTALLNDFDFLVQALFADQTNKSLVTHQRVRSGEIPSVEPTKLEQLQEIWNRLLPHRSLVITGDNIRVRLPDDAGTYPASEMSDGERAIFYLIGQVLVAQEASLLIVDEPELHVHRAIMSRLWDELEAARKDCAFVFVTHDLDFAAARSAQKLVIRDFRPAPTWLIESVPEDTGFDEALTTLILGSRRPILFVEGENSSLDRAIYRCCFPTWTVVPRGSCGEVIHAVVTMRQNAQLTRLSCAGIVDADDYSPEDVQYLNRLGIHPLQVSEIENLILMPTVSRVIASREGYKGEELEMRLAALKVAIFQTLASDGAIEAALARYSRRRIDRMLKKIDLSEAKTMAEVAAEYQRQTQKLDVAVIAEQARNRIREALKAENLPALLAIYDNKGLIALAAQHLKQTRARDFESWLTRTLRDEKATDLRDAVVALLPALPTV